MSARRREATPVPQAKADDRNYLSKSSSDGSDLNRSDPITRRRMYAGIQEPRCTDVCCTFLLVFCTSGLLYLALSSPGDIRRITHGFDFRGWQCGVRLGARTNGSLVHWCTDGPDGHMRWDRPVCVPECPKGGETIECPTGDEQTNEHVTRSLSGTITLSQTTTYTLAETFASRTIRVNQFCLPPDLKPPSLTYMMSKHGGFMIDNILHAYASFMELTRAPKLMLAVALAAFASGVIWLGALHFLTCLMMHLLFLVSILALLSAGSIVAVSSLPSEFLGDSAFASTDIITQTVSDTFASVFGTAQLGLVGAVLSSIPQRALIGLAAILYVLGFGLLLWYFFAMTSIGVVTESVEEACRIAFRQPSLWAVLPILDLVLRAIIICSILRGGALLLSTSEVHAGSIHILGTKVNGVYRSFDWTWKLAVGTLGWSFLLLWYLELISAFVAYVLSQTVVSWYFRESRTSWLPILTAAKHALQYHLGSLAFAAFVMACLRALCTVAKFFQKMASDKDAPKLLKWILFALDAFLEICKSVAKRINSAGTYTDLVLSSESYIASSFNAANLMMKYPSLMSMSTFILQPALFCGSLVYATCFGVAVYWFLESKFQSLPFGLAEECGALSSSLAFSVYASLLCFVVVSCITSIVTGISDAVIYCFLWDVQDGKVDSACAPDRFRAMVSGRLKDKVD